MSAEWIENTLRAALLEDGRRLLESLLAQVPIPETTRQPGRRRHRNRECEVFSMFGPVRLCRDYYHRAGNQGAFPLDRALGLIGNFTPAVARMLSRTAAQLSYEESSQQIQELAGLKIDPSQIQRLVQVLGKAVPQHLLGLPGPAAQAPQFYVSVDGTGVPMLADELAGRVGRGADGKAKTREVKLAALFTQTKIDEAGRPIRDPDSTT